MAETPFDNIYDLSTEQLEQLDEAEEKMLEARVQCLVVVDEQAVVVGILQIFE